MRKRIVNYVYIASEKSGLHKIGYTINPVKRLAGLCCQEKSQVSILRTFERPYGDARTVEHGAHCILEDHWVRGEWFDVGLEHAVAAVEEAACLEDRRLWHGRRADWSRSMLAERGELPSREELRELADAGFFGAFPGVTPFRSMA